MAAAADQDQDNDMDQIESSIVHDFQNLQVLTAYRCYDQMDDLVRDLTNALEDSVKQKNSHKKLCASQAGQKKTKRKSKKRKSTAKNGKLTDCTESSLDEALREYVENLTQHSDSDDWIHNSKHLPSLSTIARQAIPQVESDSFTENFSPMQPLRHKRRRFKRMAVDLEVENDTLRKQQLAKSSSKIDLTCVDSMADDASQSRSPMSANSAHEIKPGKRKRGLRCPGHSFEVDPTNEEYCTKHTDSNGSIDQDVKTESSSSLSSSECSEARFTGDEGQEGDDEQSDFFHEPGPDGPIPDIIPWWGDEPMEKDLRFEQILSGSLQHMSQAAQHRFKCRLKQFTKHGREFRSGRRYLKDRRPDYSLSRFLQERQKWGDSCSKKYLNTSGWHCNGMETKRRKKMPSNTNAPEGEYVGQHAEPIPDSNIGSRILQNMGWTPGMGLGAEGFGITTPVLAYRKSSRKGLGAS